MEYNREKVKKAVEACRAYADVLEQYQEWTPHHPNENRNTPIVWDASQGPPPTWIKLDNRDAYQLAQVHYPYKGIKEIVEGVINEYWRRAGDYLDSGAGEGSEYGTGSDSWDSYSGTKPVTVSSCLSNRTSKDSRTIGASLNTIHSTLEDAFGFKLSKTAFNTLANVYGFRIQSGIELDDWLVPMMRPLNQGGLMPLRGQARCNIYGNNSRPDHEAPEEDCRCGFYSVAHPRYLDTYDLKDSMHIGVVSQHWGKIIIGRDRHNHQLIHGYRSQWQQVIVVVASKFTSYSIQTALEKAGVEVYRGFDTIKQWWVNEGRMRFDGMVDDNAYADKGVGWGELP